MKANELMIGVFVYFCCFDGSKIAVRVTGFNDGIVYGDSKNGSHWCNIEKVEPIPLTPEILEKNGFKKHNMHDVEGQHEWSWWQDTLTLVSLWCRELEDNPEDGWMVNINSPYASCRCKVEYFHQLQHALRLCGIKKEIIL